MPPFWYHEGPWRVKNRRPLPCNLFDRLRKTLRLAVRPVLFSMLIT